MTPYSVIIPVISSFGVTSKAGLQTLASIGAINVSPIFFTSSDSRSSIIISEPFFN